MSLRWPAILGLALLTSVPQWARAASSPFSSLSSYVTWIQKHHKAPFDRRGAGIPQGGAQELIRAQASARAEHAAAEAAASTWHNVKVNQDRNPWPKSDVAAAVDPLTGNWLIMTDDFRRNFDQMFFHISTTGGKTWTDDALTGGSDFFIGSIPLTFQADPGVSFDHSGNSFLSDLNGNMIFDFTNAYQNSDTEIDVVQGFADGTYASLIPTPIDVEPCNGTFAGTFTCNAVLDKPLITTDNNPASPHNGTTYVYYTLLCNGPASGVCTDGSVTIPAFSSAIVEAHSEGAGLPFSAPALVSGTHRNAQFSDMVIDAAGVPHVFFDDFTQPSAINMWQSTRVGGVWVVAPTPVVSFVYNGLANINWSFRNLGAEEPGCGIHGFTAYCAFSANQIVGGKPESTPSVYLATVHVGSGGAEHVVRVNDDAFGDQKDHFFAWATATPNGSVYVGWYDDRHDPFNVKVDYFVGKSIDGGKTFPMQQPVNDVPFNPCIGSPGCSFFGDYTQLVSGPGGAVHAAWADTRDAASMQIWSQIVGF
ncbi:MAG: hypothetical protein JOZ89_11460 [Gammaproteobacteria bacterium]|nr:hypothetical protein [Gammaproteobacteria bacterium]